MCSEMYLQHRHHVMLAFRFKLTLFVWNENENDVKGAESDAIDISTHNFSNAHLATFKC